MQISKQYSAFTLVELIVVITILAILGTISFISLLGFQKTARESARISDLNTIAKALDFFYTQESYYPDPTDPFEITFSGSLAWNQGTFGIDTQRVAKRISEVPVDPLTKNEYAYSTTNTRQEYELGAISESLISQINPNILFPNQANAANNYYSNIKGNYNRQIVTVKEPSRIYILGVPTIITSEINSVTIQDIITNGSFAYRNGQNLPGSYDSNLPDGQTIIDTSVFVPGTVTDTTIPVIYDGSIELLNDDSEKQKFADNLVSYYQNSNLTESNLPGVGQLLEIPTDQALSYVNTLISTDTGGLPGKNIKINNTSSDTCAVVVDIFPNNQSFAALKSDGSVVTWGNSSYGGDSSSVSAQLSSGVINIYSGGKHVYGEGYAYAALKSDGSVVTWGNSSYGGDSSSVSTQLLSGVVEIYSNGNAYAALKDDGSVVTWGGVTSGGDSSSVSAQLSSGVVEIYYNGYSFAALKDDGSVITWGGATVGGDSSSVSAQLSSGVVNIYGSEAAYAALKDDGSVVTWGPVWSGGDSSSVSGQVNSGVQEIFSNSSSFAALKSDGSVVTWGSSSNGGDSSSVSGQLGSGIITIYGNGEAFAALKSDGSVITWGASWAGGDSSSVSAQLSSGVVEMFSAGYGLAALKTDGSIVVWGDSDAATGLSSISNDLNNLYSDEASFAATKDDDSLLIWGNAVPSDAGILSQISTGVEKVFSNGPSFVALKTDSSVLVWGTSWFASSDASGVDDELNCN